MHGSADELVGGAARMFVSEVDFGESGCLDTERIPRFDAVNF
jgi:hypothetical protein